MLDIDMMTACDVLMLPERGGARSVVTLRSNLALLDAVRFVVEELGFGMRERAVIRTPRRNVFANEAAGLHALFCERRQSDERVEAPVARGRPMAQDGGRSTAQPVSALYSGHDRHFPSAA